ncbi:MAG TPA: hypothetical protein DCM40_10475 [Maribacter sp.]|nr:hypothetical protein [Maribacter sp.]
MEYVMKNLQINTINGDRYTVDLDVLCYSDEFQRPALRLVGSEGSLYEYEPIMMITANLPSFNEALLANGWPAHSKYEDMPCGHLQAVAERMGSSWTFVKNYAENKGILAQLVDLGIIYDTGHTEVSGYCDLNLVFIQDWRVETSYRAYRNQAQFWKEI